MVRNRSSAMVEKALMDIYDGNCCGWTSTCERYSSAVKESRMQTDDVP